MELTRRELLATFLGLPAALVAGCRPASATLPPEGEIVGASVGIGHRLRDGFRPVPAAERWQTVDVFAPHLIRGFRGTRGATAAQFEYGSWMVANLYVSDLPASAGFPLAWDNVLYDSPSLGYVAATHQQGIDRGSTVFTHYPPFSDDEPRAARERLLGLDWAECAEIVLADLEQAHPEIRRLTERLDVMRWGHAMIRPMPGFVWSEARLREAKPYCPIHFAHSDLSGVALFEEAFYHGQRAAEEMLKGRGIDFTSMIA